MLAWRVLLICFVLATAILLRGGGSWSDVPGLVFATYSLDGSESSALWILLERICKSLVLIACALAVALSCALALAVMLSSLGGRVTRFAGWVGRAITCVPPMAWALGAMVLIIKNLDLPVETLFPCHPLAVQDSFALQAGRALWAWLVPMTVLAVPALGAALFVMTHRLDSLLQEPELGRLKSRGLNRAQMIYRHFVPQLRVHLARLARPLAATLLAYDIAVEHLLGFDGWGRFVAAQVTSGQFSPRPLAVAMWTGGWILALQLALIALLDKRGLPLEAEEETDSAQLRSWRSTVSGAAIAVMLMTAPVFAGRLAIWSPVAGAHHAWVAEVMRAMTAAAGAFALLLIAGFFMSLSRRHLLSRGWAAALSNAPVLLALLTWPQAEGAKMTAVMITLALPGLAALRETFHEVNESDFIEASISLGRSRTGVWWTHVLRGTMPGLLNWTLRSVATALLVFCTLDFFSPDKPDAPGWGHLMRDAAGGILDDATSALAPALLLALWSLSFRLLSRAFRIEAPQPRTSPFSH